MVNLVHEFLIENVQRFADNQVLKDRTGVTLNMLELDELTNQIANFIIGLNIKKGDTVALFLETSTYAAAFVFGVMKSGAIYVPLNIQSPIAVIDKILYQTNPKLIIIDSRYEKLFSNSSYVIETHTPILANTYNTISSNEVQVYSLNELKPLHKKKVINQPNIIPKDLLCIIYTSGTTGNPKGVMCRHENIVPFFHYVSKTFKHGSTFVTMSRSPLSFDPYLTEIIPNMMNGGRVYFCSFTTLSSFFRTIEREKINDFDCPPSLMNILIKNPQYIVKYDLSSIKEIWIGYEYCHIPYVKKLQELFPDAKIFHGYGTSETYASSAFYEVCEIPSIWKALPIGIPVDGTELLIINEQGTETEPGEIGEMVVRGSSVMPGYWKDADATKKAFRPNPLYPQNNERVYYTGDLFTSDSFGNQFYVGRCVNQKKINGYRVELMEIERCILQLSWVEGCEPIVVTVDDIDKIICYIVSDERKRELPMLRNHCKENLETYKIPSEFIYIDKMPINNNGKVDINKLKSWYYESINSKGKLVQEHV